MKRDYSETAFQTFEEHLLLDRYSAKNSGLLGGLYTKFDTTFSKRSKKDAAWATNLFKNEP